MPNQRDPSQFAYTDEELETNKVIAHLQAETEKLRMSNEQGVAKINKFIAQAEALARKKGVTDAQFAAFKLEVQARNNNVSRDVPTATRSWRDIVDEANTAIPGYVTIEDICSAKEFEDAFRYLDEIDNEFKRKTGLTKIDITFIGIAIALQCARQYVLQPYLDKHQRLSAKQNDDVVKKAVPKNWQDLLLASVPYDVVERRDKATESTGLSGSTHRYRTLGHDPLLGWLFGPVSILSDTLTKTDFITSYNVVNKKIGSKVCTWKTFDRAFEQAKIGYNFPVSVVRQGIHFGSDYFSKQGLPIPIIGSVNNDLSQYLIRNNINMLNVTEGMMLSTMINALVSCVHNLFNTTGISAELYEVRTRKILSISNAVATYGNIACVAITKNVKLLDLGGLLVTISRLCSDARFFARVKQEFIEGKLDEEWGRISEDIGRLCDG